MAKSEIKYDQSIILTSSWRVITGSNGIKEMVDGPTYESTRVTFNYKLPAGSEVKSAIVHAEWSYPATGFYYRAINDQHVDSNADFMIDIDPAATSVDVTFTFRPQGHTNYTSNRITDSTTIDNIFLLIEYSCGTYLYRAEGDVLVPYQIYHAEDGKLVPYQLFKCISTEEELSRIAQLMQDEYPKSKVDLLNRPQIDAAVMNAAGWDVPEGSYSTVDTVTYTYNDFGLSGDYAINVTPILDDGTVIDGGVDGLWQYISDELNNGNQFEDLDIFLGKYNTVEEAEAAAQRLHELQEDYYALKEETAENKLVQY